MLEYIQCPAIVLLCVSLMYVMWFVSHRQKIYCNISSVSCLSHIRSSSRADVCLSVCWFVYVCVCISFWVLALALAAYSVPLSLLFTLSVFLYMHTRHPQPCTGNEHPPKRHPGRLLSKSTRGQSVLVWHNRRTSFVLFWCSQFKQREECWERGTILLRGGGKDGRREGERSSERNKVREQEGDRFVCVHVCVCTGGDKSKRGNGSAESAFYSLQLHT